MPSKEECNRIKSLGFDLLKVIQGYKGSMESRQGNRALDILDRAMSEIAQLEQSAWDECRLSENETIRIMTTEECRAYLLSKEGTGRDFRRTDVYSSDGELIAEKGGE